MTKPTPRNRSASTTDTDLRLEMELLEKEIQAGRKSRVLQFLIIEEVQRAELVKAALLGQFQNAQIITVPDVQAALNYLETTSPDVVILDPEKTSLETTHLVQVLKSASKFNKTKILITPKMDGTVKPNLLSASWYINGALQNPFNKNELIKKIDDIINSET